MINKILLSALISQAVLSLAVAADSTHPFDRNVEDLNTSKEPPMLGVHWARGAQPGRATSGSPLMTYHGGKIMPTAVTQVIL